MSWRILSCSDDDDEDRQLYQCMELSHGAAMCSRLVQVSQTSKSFTKIPRHFLPTLATHGGYFVTCTVALPPPSAAAVATPS